MVPHEGWQMPIEEAARNNDPQKVRRAIRDGHVVNMLCDRGATRLGRTIFEALLHAALNSPVRTREMVKLLLDSGADPRMPQADRRTPLHLAIRYDDGLTDVFCELGVDVNAQAEDGCTPMHDMLRVWDKTASRPRESLQHRKARTNICDCFGMTARDLMDGNRLQEAKAKHHPRTDADIFNTYATLEKRLKFKAPRPLVLHILDLASYWLCTTSTRHELATIHDRTPPKDQIYLRSPPLPITHPFSLRELRCTVTNSDKAWTVHGWAQGSFEQCSSYIDVVGQHSSGSPMELAGEEHAHFLFDNIHGDGYPTVGACTSRGRASALSCSVATHHRDVSH